MAKQKKAYINNEELLGEIRDYLCCDEISNRLHLMFYEMRDLVSPIILYLISRPRFLRYTKEWKEDMIQTAYLKCIDVLQRKRFDDTKINPFSYFTTVISNSFLDSIHLENKQKIISENLRDIMSMTEENVDGSCNGDMW